MLRLHRVGRAHALQQFRREARDAGEAQVLALGQRVADAELAMVRHADDVAAPGLVRGLAVLRQKQHRVRDRHRLAGAHMLELHAAPEMAGAQPQEGDTVPMLRVHVRLHLEHDAGDGFLARIHGAAFRRARARRRRVFLQALQQLQNAK